MVRDYCQVAIRGRLKNWRGISRQQCSVRWGLGSDSGAGVHSPRGRGGAMYSGVDSDESMGHGGLRSQIAGATQPTRRMDYSMDDPCLCCLTLLCLALFAHPSHCWARSRCVESFGDVGGGTHTWVDCRIAMILTLNTIGLSGNGSDTVRQQMLLHVAIYMETWCCGLWRSIEGRV